MRIRMAGLLALTGLCVSASASAQMGLPGKFEVTDSGSASYTIPIAVVPGTAGLEPKLSLSYDSRSGNGLLGVGWSLSGLPSITRCGRTIAQDGQTGGVAFDANDRFCLDGQRLVATTGTYGADQTEYRTERESFSKVVSYGSAGSGPSWFRVWTKAGLVMEFGNSVDSKIEAQGKASVRVWALNRTSDTKGNFFTVSYSEDNANGEYRPSRIDYTGNTAANIQPQNSVRFVYETRPDIVPLYQGGSLIKTTKRMITVQVWQGKNLAREYRVQYEVGPLMENSRLKTVSQCDGTATCLPPPQASYPGIGPGWIVQANVNSENDQLLAYTPLPADFNGDGKMDMLWVYADAWGRAENPNTRILWLSRGDGTFQRIDNVAGGDGSLYIHRPLIADFNGDGNADILWSKAYSDGRTTSNPLAARTLWLSNGDGTFQVFPNVNGEDGQILSFMPNLADFNGDGKMDVLWIYADAWGRAENPNTRILWLSRGDGSFQRIDNVAGADGGLYIHRPLIADFNGDGKSDVLWSKSYSDGRTTSNPLAARTLWLSNGDGTFQVFSNVNGEDEQILSFMPNLADFNGDGKMDMLWVYADAWGRAENPNTRILWLSRGDGTFQRIDNVAGGDGSLYIHRPLIADFNGDGNADILWSKAYSDGRTTSNPLAARTLWLSNGDGTFQVFPNVNGEDEQILSFMPNLADFNGDGKMDVLWVYADAYGRAVAPNSRVLWLSRGDGTFQRFDNLSSTDGTANTHKPLIADYNGDGKADVLWNLSDEYGRSPVPYTQRTLWTWQGYQAPQNDVLMVLSSGMGVQTQITTDRINAGSLYTRDTGASACVWPCQDLNGPLWVTKEVKSSNGLGGEYRSTYRYAGAKSNAHGRGFLGFRQMTVKDEQTGVEQVTTTRQDYPFAGLVSSREKKLGSQLLNRSTNTYAATDLGGTRRYPYLTTSLEESWELTGAALPAVTTTYQYDAWGNATQVGVSTGDGHAKTTNNTYSNDAANWLLGRLTRSEVTSTTPGN
jgi:hypothetical protein